MTPELQTELAQFLAYIKNSKNIIITKDKIFVDGLELTESMVMDRYLNQWRNKQIPDNTESL